MDPEWNLSYELIIMAAEYWLQKTTALYQQNFVTGTRYITTVQEPKPIMTVVQGLEVPQVNSDYEKDVDFNKFEQHTYTMRNLSICSRI